MDHRTFQLVEQYMLRCMEDSAHDQEHVYRVLYMALLIAEQEENVDYDVLVCSCLLHDIGRKEQFENPRLCHAQVGGEKAFRFLTEQGFSEAFADQVRECIAAHRYRENRQPQSLEGKILFDADKLDVAGAMGIARTLLYQGHEGIPLYYRKEDGPLWDDREDTRPSFFQEYHFKLETMYDRFYTQRGRELALQRRQAAVDYYHALQKEVQQSSSDGNRLLEKLLSP